MVLCFLLALSCRSGRGPNIWRCKMTKFEIIDFFIFFGVISIMIKLVLFP
jgi:hypothetical protein